jgi:hypothetical protein
VLSVTEGRIERNVVFGDPTAWDLFGLPRSIV